jgi:hypothetical protein
MLLLVVQAAAVQVDFLKMQQDKIKLLWLAQSTRAAVAVAVLITLVYQHIQVVLAVQALSSLDIRFKDKYGAFCRSR